MASLKPGASFSRKRQTLADSDFVPGAVGDTRGGPTALVCLGVDIDDGLLPADAVPSVPTALRNNHSPIDLTDRLLTDDRLCSLLPSRQALVPAWAKPRGGPMTDLATNLLYYGDNLDILRRYLPKVGQSAL